ncbi:MAG: hypothetical protein JL56_11280 [Desulfotomaculum sp. BICA1-6]|nr:MAG: hypothetical protein JL56_11280 [Desulfotomaculum sp. BICA1-6]
MFGTIHSFCNRMRKGWPVIALAALLLCFIVVLPPAAAENDGSVQIEAELGWQGWGAAGRHAPAVVVLKNTGSKDLNGVIEALNYIRFTPPPPPGSPPGATQPARDIPMHGYGERVSLPAGGEKKITLWFPVNGPGSRVDFIFRAGKNELARISTKMPGAAVTGPMPLAVGVLGVVPPALERVRPIMPDGVYRAPQVKELTKDLFPRRGEQLDAFQTILATAAGAATLDDGQRRALAGWVELGGRLVVSGGLGVGQALDVLPENTLEVTTGQLTEKIGWQAEAAWLGTTFNASSASSVAELHGPGELWGPEERPLGLRYALGSGAVTVLSFDPNQSPWRAGVLGEALWAKFLTPESEDAYYRGMPANYQLGNLVYQTNNLPRDAFVNWQPVGVFLFVFLLAAGPITYLVLRRMQRPEFTWVVVPLLSILFAGGVYVYMIQTGGNVLVNIVQVVDARETGKTAGYTAVGYFVPTRGEFTAMLDDPDLAVQVQAMGGRPIEMMSENDSPQYRVIRGSDLEVQFGDISQWNMRGISFVNNQLAEKATGLSATVEVQGSSITGRVKNETNMKLDYVTVLWGSQYRVLGDLNPGEERTLAMEITVPQYNPQGNYGPQYPNVYQVFQYPDGPPPPPQPGVPYNPPPGRQLNVEEQRRVEMGGGWTDQMRHQGPVESGWPLTLLAWSDSATGEAGIKQYHRPPSYLTMFVARPQMKLPGGKFTIPAGLVVPEVVQSQVRGMFGHNNLTGLEGGSLVFAFKPQLQQNVTFNEISIGFDYYKLASGKGGGMGPPGPNPSPVPAGAFEIYHPGRGEWVELSGSRTFNLAGDYVAPNGEVRLRVIGGDPNQGTGFYFLPPTVAYGGDSA